MDLINIALLLVLTFDCILIIISLIDNEKKDRIAVWYIINVATIGLWLFCTILFRSSEQSSIITNIKYVYVAASLVVSSFYYFTFIFPKRVKKYSLQIYLLIICNIILVYLTLFSNKIISGAQVINNAENEFYPGSLYWLYSLFVIGYLSSGFYRLFKKSYYSSDKIERAQLFYLATGYTISGSVAMITNLLLPMFGVSRYNWIGGIISIFMVFGFTLAVSKYKLFNIKVVTAEIVIFILWILTAIRTFLPNQSNSTIVNFGFLFLTIIVGLLLIRSVKNEIKQREKLKELDALKSEFISLATHHIASPLTAINGYISLLQEENFGTVPAEMKSTLDIVQKSTDNLTTIVRDFLDVTRIDSHEIQYVFTNVDFKEIVINIVDNYKDKAKRKNIKLNLNVENGKEYFLKADNNKFSQAISNILENSIKYSSDSDIYIDLKNENNKITLKISDSAIRNLPTMSPKLAQKFTNSTDANEANVMGNGLGIYVAKQIIEANHGIFWIENNKDNIGLTFYLQF